jgi:hypothetical protein
MKKMQILKNFTLKYLYSNYLIFFFFFSNFEKKKNISLLTIIRQNNSKISNIKYI